jgi:small subunit ribosomal protein S17
MPRKKKDELENESAEAVETTEAAAEGSDEPVKKTKKAKTDDAAETSVVDTVIEAATDTLVSVAETVGKVAADVVSAVTSPSGTEAVKVHKRAEKIGIVASDKMIKTVTVRVDRLVKHPVYRKYVKKRKKFMAHDDLGAKIGDKVKIVETRPLSARKRWRVVEIIKKAEL